MKQIDVHEQNYLDAQQFAGAIVRDALRGAILQDDDMTMRSALAFDASVDLLKATAAVHRGEPYTMAVVEFDHMEEQIKAWCRQTNSGVGRWECN